SVVQSCASPVQNRVADSALHSTPEPRARGEARPGRPAPAGCFRQVQSSPVTELIAMDQFDRSFDCFQTPVCCKFKRRVAEQRMKSISKRIASFCIVLTFWSALAFVA